MPAADRNTNNLWAYRPAASMMENRGQPLNDAPMDIRVQSVGDAMIEDNTVQPCQEGVGPEHFGAFGDVSLYSGFDGGLHTSPRHPSLSQISDDTPNIPMACPNEVADCSTSYQSKVSLLIVFFNSVLQLV